METRHLGNGRYAVLDNGVRVGTVTATKTTKGTTYSPSPGGGTYATLVGAAAQVKANRK